MVIPKDTRTPQEGLIIAGFGAVLLFILVGSVWWGFAHAPSTTPNTAPQFSADSQVRITVPGSVSISVLAKCPTGFSTDPVGVASEGDEAFILERKACTQEWW